MQFDVAGALKAGATPDQIAQFLAQKQGFDLDGALGAGASVDQVIGFLAKPIETKEAGIVDRLKDTGIDVAKGFVGAGEALVGVGNLVSGNLVGDGLAKIGFDPKRTKEILSSGYSEERQAENAAVRDAEGFVGTARSLLENPAVAIGSMVESAPMMLGSAGAVRAVAGGMLARAGIAPGTAAAAEFLKRPEVLAKLATVGSAAEGATTAGSIQEQARQEGSGYADSAGYALAGGAGTALIGKAASKLLPDADVIAGTLGMGGRNSGAGFLGAAKGIGKGMVQEGVLEEMPQSAQEQAFTNLATSKPWNEGVAESAAQGLIVGAAMGGGVNLVDATSRRRAVAEQALQQATDAASAAAAANEMASVDLDAAVNEVEQAVSAYLRPDGGIPTPDQAMAQPTIETPQPLTPQEKQELARQQLQSTPVADPLADLRLQVNPSTTMADVAQRRDAVETSAIERMMAADMARPAAQELAPPVATPAPDLAQASAQETTENQLVGLEQKTRERMVNQLMESAAEPSGYFASRMIPAIDQQLAVLKQPPLTPQERERVVGLTGAAQAFTQPTLPEAPAPAIPDRGADNTSLEARIPEKIPRPSRILGQPTSSYTDDQLTRMIEQPDIPAVSRRGASIELTARQAAQSKAATLTNEGTMPQAAPVLEQPQAAPAVEPPAMDATTLAAKQRWEQRRADEQQQAAQNQIENERYNAYVIEQEREAERRLLQGDNIIQQANGKPFKKEANAQAMLDKFSLSDTHAIQKTDKGFVLRRMPPAEQAEQRRKAEGRESYMEAQAAVLAEMGIGETADGEIDATDEQFAEIERRTAERLGRNAQPADSKPSQPPAQQNQGNSLPQGARLETADKGMVQGMVRYVDGAGQPLSDWAEDEADALAQAIQRGRGAPAEKLLRDHFVAAASADTVMQGNDAAQMLRMAQERDALVKQLVDAGYTQAEIGANSLGLPLEEFNRLVKEGIYSRERGAPDSLFPKRSTSRKAAAGPGKNSKQNQPPAQQTPAVAATETIAPTTPIQLGRDQTPLTMEDGRQDTTGALFSRERGTETPRGSKLATPSDGRIVNTDAKTTGKAPVPGSKHTVQDGDTSHSFTVVDTSKLGAQGRLIQQIARIFGKRVVAFQSDTLQADGFVMNADPTSIYLNVESTVSPMAVFGHELTHQMKKDNPQAYAALEAVVQRNMDEEGMAKFRQEYGEEADIEELSSDLVGDRFREPAFWEDVFNEVAAQNPTGAAAIVQRVGQAIRKAVDTLLKTIRQQGFNADAYVTNLEEIRDAVRVAMVDYAKQQREPAMAGVKDAPVMDGKAKFSPADRKATSSDDTFVVDGVARPRRNSEGQIIAETDVGLQNFWRWFGDSKVVDSDGRPLVVYHGTRDKNFSSFDKARFNQTYQSELGDGFYFSTYKDIARAYSGPGGRVIEAYLKADNLVAIKNPEHARGISRSDGRVDGLSYDADSRDGKPYEYVVFKPTQIKSATSNNGDFDPAKKDITKSRRRNIFGQQVLPTWTAPTETKLDDFLYVMQDKMVDTKRVVEAVKGAIGRIDDQWNPYLQEELYHGRTATKTKQFLGDELRPLLQDMQSRGVGMADFEEYLHNRHAEERNRQIAKVNPGMQDGGSGIDTADARAYLAGLDPTKRRAYEALARRIDAITAGTRQLLVDNGLETQDTIDAWDAAYSQYVPLNREDLDFSSSFTSTGTGQGFSVKGAASKRATGSKRKVVDILANIAMQRERAIVRAEKNRVATAVYGLAASQPNTDFWLAVNPDAIKDPIGLRNELVKMGLNPLDAQNLIEEPTQTYIDPRTGLVSQRINPALRSSPNVLAVRVDGKDRYVFFNASDERSQRMVTALKNLDADQLGRVMGMAAQVTRWFASVNTQYNPIFGAINFMRDVQGAALQLSTTPIADMKAQVVGDVIPALRGIYADIRAERKGNARPGGKWSALWEEFQKEGAQTGYRDQFSKSAERAQALESELKRITEGKAKQFGRAMFDWLSDYNETMENAVRLAAYKAAKDKGLSNQQAASVAKNLTVNFNRKGQIATQAGALYAFFNAAIQGSTRLVQTLTGPAGKTIIGGGLLLGVIQAVMLAAAGYDDDEPPEFARERGFIIPMDWLNNIGGPDLDGKYFTIPMPLGYNVIPNTSRVMTEFVLSGYRDPAKRVAQITGALLETFNPISNAGWSVQTIAPTFADPLVALAENRDWTGKDIAKKDRSNTNPTPGYTRAKETASWFSKELSYYLNLASGGTKYKPGFLSPTPDQIDYLIGQVTGGVGREALKIEQTIASTVTGEELPPYKIPLAGRFYGDTKSASAESNRFYENITRLNEHENEIKGRRENRENPGEYLRENPEARLYQFANKIEQDVTKLRKRRRELLERGASKESIKMIETQITNRMKRLNDRVRAVQDAED